MTLKQFMNTLSDETPDPQLGDLAAAMWWQANGDWERAHSIVQGMTSSEAQWIHAFLHRVEGDHNNSSYWYSSAGRTMPTNSLEAEWREIASTLLEA
jgi:hypothetical protein